MDEDNDEDEDRGVTLYKEKQGKEAEITLPGRFGFKFYEMDEDNNDDEVALYKEKRRRLPCRAGEGSW